MNHLKSYKFYEFQPFFPSGRWEFIYGQRMGLTKALLTTSTPPPLRERASCFSSCVLVTGVRKYRREKKNQI